MATELQFAAVAAVFLTWCLVSALWSFFAPNHAVGESPLIWREDRSDGWSRWREVHFGLAAADRRFLHHPGPVLDNSEYAALLDAVRCQHRGPESTAIQFAIVRATRHPDRDRNEVVFVSDVHAAVALSDRVD
jgi:hypothetical protein